MASHAVLSQLSNEQQSTILTQLELILSSPSFRSSKRYPTMLEHCVRLTISGDLENLRERQLGITLFSRPAGYDTSSDPIVRMAASEIRKRLAQFYDEAGEDTHVRIALPSGSYVAEFRFRENPLFTEPPTVRKNDAVPAEFEHDTTSNLKVAETRAPITISPITPARTQTTVIAWTMVVIALVFSCLFVYRQWVKPALPGFWQSAGEGAGGQVVLVVGQLPSNAPTTVASSDLPLQADIFLPNRFVTVEAASSSLAICSMMARSNLNCSLKPAPLVEISDVQKRPTIFLGAYSNPWTLRISAPLPYRFGPLSCKCIIDAKSAKSIAEVDFSTPRGKILTDYSIVARIHSEVTDGPAWVIAGIGPMSTPAAAEFASSAKASQELLAMAPKGWKGMNVEAVLATDVVNGIPGHTRILKTAFW